MKYFKPDLLVRCRSLDDDQAEVAAAEWEKGIVAYRERLRAFQRQLPLGARRLISRHSLHDAKVLAMTGAQEQPWFTVLLQLEPNPTRPGDVLELGYHIVTGPYGGVSFRKHPELEKGPSGLGWILYHEFDLEEPHGFFTHSLLLTSGHEVEIRFHHLRVRRLEEVFLSPLELPEGDKTWPLVKV